MRHGKEVHQTQEEVQKRNPRDELEEREHKHFSSNDKSYAGYTSGSICVLHICAFSLYNMWLDIVVHEVVEKLSVNYGTPCADYGTPTKKMDGAREEPDCRC